MAREKSLLSRSTRTIRSSVFSTKSITPVRCESKNERNFVLLNEFATDVVEILQQPETFRFNVYGTKCRYTPDFRIVKSDGSICYIEIKPASELEKPEIQEKLRVAGEFIEEKGFEFRVVTDTELNKSPVLLLNANYLKRFRTLNTNILVELREKIPLLPTTFGSLVSSIGRLNALELIANQLVCCDLTNHLTDDIEITYPQESDYECIH